MATIAKSHAPFANARPEGSWGANGTKDHGKDVIEGALRAARELPKRAQEGMRDRPEATLAVVAGTSFALGMLLGSRIVRAVAFAALPVIATQLVRGAPADRIQELASRLLQNVTGKA